MRLAVDQRSAQQFEAANCKAEPDLSLSRLYRLFDGTCDMLCMLAFSKSCRSLGIGLDWFK